MLLGFHKWARAKRISSYGYQFGGPRSLSGGRWTPSFFRARWTGLKKKGPGSKKHVQGLEKNVTGSKNVLGLKNVARLKKVRVEKMF